MKYFFCVVLICSAFFLQAQQVFKQTISISELEQDTCIVTEHPFTSLVVYDSHNLNVSEITLIVDDELFVPNIDHHITSDKVWSEQLFLQSQSYSVCISSGIPQSFSIDALFAPEIDSSISYSFLKSQDCEKPPYISQDIWRSGLPEPNYTRIFTETHNIIIHHSAGSNTDTNYTTTIRNIYIYHTQSHGWSDIGYNYIIAQNGAIYAGRDPGTYPQDLVQGAHFSGANTNTLGICMLGNYELAPVPQIAYDALVSLVSWKCAKDSLQPHITSPHPLNQHLPVIAGHSDGGPTLCPGAHLYELLPILRADVADNLVLCGHTITTDIEEVQAHTHCSHLCGNQLIVVYSIDGKKVFEGTFKKMPHSFLQAQLYVIVRVE